MGVTLPLVRIILPEFLPSFGFNETGASLDSVAKRIQGGMETVAELADLRSHYPRSVPHEIILDEAAYWGADLIVIGKLGHRGVAHILLGSVAERVIELSPVPVLVMA